LRTGTGMREEQSAEARLNEREIIETIFRALGKPGAGFSELGDDVSWVEIPPYPEKIVVKCDMLVGSTDVPKGMDLFYVARKSIVASLSDLAAKGARPVAALISLGVPRSMRRRDVERLIEGFRACGEEFGIRILGGDTNEAKDLVIDSILLGLAKRIVPRSGAGLGELVFVTNGFGLSSLGLRMLQGRIEVPEPLRERALTAFLAPVPRLELGIALAELNIATSSIDCSDGLILSLYDIAGSSKVDIVLDRIPIPDVLLDLYRKRPRLVRNLVTCGGEEYELIFTVRREEVGKLTEVSSKLNVKVEAIGEVKLGTGRVLLRTRRGLVLLPKKGWIHL